MRNIEIKIPHVGGDSNINVAEIYVKVGDIIKKNDNLLMLETDKATVEVPSTNAGTITEILVKVGDKVKEGLVIFKLDESEDTDNRENIHDTKNLNIEKTKLETKKIDLKCEVLVLGAGPGGYTAAFRASDLGKKVVLVEKHLNLGGVCLNVGCIPSKALLHIARVINEVEEISSHGVEFGRPKLDLDKIRGYKNSVVKKLTNGLSGLAKQRKVEIVNGTALFTSSNTIEINNGNQKQLIQFESAIIATGSSVFKLPTFPFEDPRIITSTGALSLESIPQTMLVVGGGIIGLEMAEVYSTLGSKVTVVEMGDNLISAADRDLVKVLETRLKKREINVYLKTKCAKIETKSDGIYVVFEGPLCSTEPHKFDKVLVAIGRKPNGLNIGLDSTGVFVNENGFIPVDRSCRTNISHIYAIGDVVGQPMLAHKATHEGRVAAENCAGLKSFFDAKVIPSVAYTDPEIAWVGITESEASRNGIEVEVARFPWLASGRALGNGRDEGFTKIITEAKTHKIIGAGIVGINAGELIAEICLAIEMGCDIHDIALTIHPHPTLSESVAFACEMIDGSITDLYVPKSAKNK